MAAERGILETLQKVREWANEQLTAEELKTNLLLATDSKGRTVLLMAALHGKLDIFQKVWKWAKEQLTAEEIKLIYY
jgi:hypothetical protein